MAVTVGSDAFKREVLESELPVVVDFWAEWCPPCKMLTPVFDKTAQRFEGRVKFVKVNVDESPDVAGAFGISTIPNLLFFKDGQVVGQSVGYVSEAQLTAKVDGTLA